MIESAVKLSASVSKQAGLAADQLDSDRRRGGVFVVNRVQRITRARGETAERFGEAGKIDVAHLQQAFEFEPPEEERFDVRDCVPSSSL